MILPSTLACLQIQFDSDRCEQNTHDFQPVKPRRKRKEKAPVKVEKTETVIGEAKTMKSAFSIDNLLAEKKPRLDLQVDTTPIHHVPLSALKCIVDDQHPSPSYVNFHDHKGGLLTPADSTETESIYDICCTSPDVSQEVYSIPSIPEYLRDAGTPDSDATVAAMDFSINDDFEEEEEEICELKREIKEETRMRNHMEDHHIHRESSVPDLHSPQKPVSADDTGSMEPTSTTSPHEPPLAPLIIRLERRTKSEDTVVPKEEHVVVPNGHIVPKEEPVVPPLRIRLAPPPPPPPRTPMRSRANSRLRPSPPLLNEKIVEKPIPVLKRKSADKENIEKAIPKKRAPAAKKAAVPKKTKGRKTETEESPWTPIGTPVRKRVHLKNETSPLFRECYPSAQHVGGVKIYERQDVIIKLKEGDNNVAKICHIFINPDTGILETSVLWYYNSQQLETDQNTTLFRAHDREVLASKHLDTVAFTTVNEAVKVITFNEYNRYIAENKQDSLPPAHQNTVTHLWSRGEDRYKRRYRLPCDDTPPETVFFCRYIYDFVKKRVQRVGERKELSYLVKK